MHPVFNKHMLDIAAALNGLTLILKYAIFKSSGLKETYARHSGDFIENNFDS